ncbi:DUF1993 domain-containing protein [Sphingosinicella microcystinivorans]|uniref:DUF1993 domain-containing protein n=1 Tax=Sphingosinicella microcystinivorans TaxID=335406 RepID=UPI003B67C036
MLPDQKKGTVVALTNLLVPTYVQMLKALSGWLNKAQAQMPDDQAQALLSARLAPDMFPLSTQVRFACVQAQEGMFRLKGEAFPASIDVLLDEGRNAAERPGSLADAQARINETIALVESLASEEFDESPERPIAHALPMGMIFDLTAEQYARDWAIPQFYFHVMAAYAILRSEGVDLGKADYVAHMFAYLRPGTMPSQ